MSTTVELKMAKASKDDIRVLREFLQLIEEVVEYGTFTPHDDDFEADSIEVEADKLRDLIRERWFHVGPAWRRVVMGCDILIDNCCDAELPHLAWTPHIKALLERSAANA